jgi:hypothetical protein
MESAHWFTTGYPVSTIQLNVAVSGDAIIRALAAQSDKES